MTETRWNGQGRLNLAEYRERVAGCWMGKNIGGTLGAPLEGRREIFDVKEYLQTGNGKPLPNDDLDLQLVWLKAVEDNGLYRIDEQLLGEYWLAHIVGPWNEYGIAKFNIANGLIPPLSGLCNNDEWKNSNGAWIRSEIWACLCPGMPDEAVKFAWCDACVDHAGEGIWAELFTAALEAAAFVESDIDALLRIALNRIPPDCRVAQTIRLVMHEHEKHTDWKTVRNQVIEANADLGWFQAPGNLGFVTIGLLYGECDFGKTICLAVNCGDDTDCTGATCGAIMGILHGCSRIPEKWTAPIGHEIVTVALNTYLLDVPGNIDELTDRVIAAKWASETGNPAQLLLTNGATTEIGEVFRRQLSEGAVLKDIPERNSRTVALHCYFGTLYLEYEKSPIMHPGETQKLHLMFSCRQLFFDRAISLDWQLPEGWTMNSGPFQNIRTCGTWMFGIRTEITAGPFPNAFCRIPIKVRISDRAAEDFVVVPFQCAGTVSTENVIPLQTGIERDARRKAVREYFRCMIENKKNAVCL